MEVFKNYKRVILKQNIFLFVIPATVIILTTISIYLIENYSKQNVMTRLKNYENVLAIDFWRIDYEILESHLKIILNEGVYEKISATSKEKVLISIEQKNNTDNFLKKQLTRKIPMTMKIFYRKIYIGNIDVIWLNSNLYFYLVAMMLLTIFACLLYYVKKAKRDKSMLEYRVIQNSRLTSLGKMAAGIAHELNNPLTCIVGHSFKIINEDKKNSHNKYKERAEKIYVAAQRMKKIITQMNVFINRNHENESDALIDVNNVIRSTRTFWTKQFDEKNISLMLQLSNDIEKISGNGGLLSSVFQNFLSNSFDAFKNIGDNRNKYVHISTFIDKGKLCIVYQDNACGMSSEESKHLCEPFFTTKEIGQGVGMGMFIAHTIIENYNGEIEVNTNFGKGTKFTILFPLAGTNINTTPINTKKAA